MSQLVYVFHIFYLSKNPSTFDNIELFHYKFHEHTGFHQPSSKGNGFLVQVCKSYAIFLDCSFYPFRDPQSGTAGTGVISNFIFLRSDRFAYYFPQGRFMTASTNWLRGRADAISALSTHELLNNAVFERVERDNR
jgi:hypothetical protein